MGFEGCPRQEMFPIPKDKTYLTSVIVNQETNQIDVACLVDDLNDELPARIESIVECNNVIGVKPGYQEELSDFFDDKLRRLEICIRWPKKCQ